jgi:hypothetical protein
MTSRQKTAIAVALAALAAAGLVLWRRGGGGARSAAGAGGGAAAAGVVAPRRMSQEDAAPAFDPATATPAERARAAPVTAPVLPDAGAFTDPRTSGITDDIHEQLLALARSCVARAARPPEASWWIRFRYDLVIERGAGHLENVEVIETEMQDPALFQCVMGAIKGARLQSVPDSRRITGELTIPLGELGTR